MLSRLCSQVQEHVTLSKKMSLMEGSTGGSSVHWVGSAIFRIMQTRNSNVPTLADSEKIMKF
ncbi:hypothetical protein DPMN_172264 [Dreissena polymorpha]|uniref:Uncharacterized protein n=1 Tax=Dreissena polymorpha TaxID=45954 RepID=A0A9D4DZI0_DREPO|nr:hypothetical protein DPMN_172264 [Dreissena polymorpha]